MGGRGPGCRGVLWGEAAADWVCGEIDIFLNGFTVDDNVQNVVFQFDVNLVPFTRRFGGIDEWVALLQVFKLDDSAEIVETNFFFSQAIENLNFNADGCRLRRVGNAEVESRNSLSLRACIRIHIQNRRIPL